MGVINITPDSFSDGGLALDAAAALDIAESMQEAGADLIDIGGESTRPGASPVDAADETARVRPVLRAMARAITIPISIDTCKAGVAAMALDEGAAIVNDISAFAYDPELGPLVAARGCPAILMHTRGRPADMYEHADYRDVIGEVSSDLARSVDRAIEWGVGRDRILVDPGLGFAKRAEHSLAALAGIDRLAALGFPVVVGPSRKSFLTAITGPLDADARDWPTAAAVTAAVLGGAHVVRVHRVAHLVAVVRVADAIRRAAAGEAPAS